MRLSPAVLLLGLLSAGSLALFPAMANADEIRSYDPQTGALQVDKVHEVTAETWTQISYRRREGEPLKQRETRLVKEVIRGPDDANAAKYRNAKDEYQKGAYKIAALLFADVAGAGLRRDQTTDEEKYTPFTAEDKKPKWFAEYAHYWFADALYRHAMSKKEKDVKALEYALRAVDADAKDEKGFLARFKEGKSRWYPDAMLLKANILLAMGKPDDALKALEALGDAATRNALAPRWAFEAQRGKGRIQEARGARPEAEAAYEAASSVLVSLLDTAPDPWTRSVLGRHYNELRAEKARVIRQGAEAADSPPEYRRLRDYLVEGTPERLRAKFAGKTKEVQDAILSGALSPTVQAMARNGIGLSLLAEKKYVEALWEFDAVRIKFFQVTEEVPRALYYLAKAASGAADAAPKAEAKDLFKAQAAAARQELVKQFPESTWAGKK